MVFRRIPGLVKPLYLARPLVYRPLLGLSARYQSTWTPSAAKRPARCCWKRSMASCCA